jgi:peptide/nickel transport system permease protein
MGIRALHRADIACILRDMIDTSEMSGRRPLIPETLGRVTRYAAFRLTGLFLTVVVGVYLTILIANLGGQVDDIRRAQIRDQVGSSVLANTELQALPPAELRRIMDQRIALEEDRLGLDQPFMVRSVGYLVDALSLSLGRAEHLVSDSGSRQVRLILLERLPATLVLFVTSYLILFGTSLVVGLYLSRRYGSALDRTVIALAPTSAAPAWFYGIFLILICAAWLRILPFGGMVSAPPPETPLAYLLDLGRHLVLPITAILIGSVFLSIYSSRTFFLIYANEDYVDMARAKGLPSAAIERRYVLRPALPPIVTGFALSLVGIWTGSIILEIVFNWPGIGRLLFQAIGLHDTPVIVASVVVYAYLLAITVFLLDIVYALVDPRVRIEATGGRS